MNLLSTLKDRIRSKVFLAKIMSAEEAAEFVLPNMTIGCSGFTSVGYPKVLPMTIAKRAEEGKIIPLTIWCGASSGYYLDGLLSNSKCIKARYPYQTNKTLRNMINDGLVDYFDMHLSICGQNLRYGFYGHIDIALVEATAITESGGIVPSTAVGDIATYIQCADKVIVEVNLAQPDTLEGIHDIYIPDDPPKRAPIPIKTIKDRIGQPYISCPHEKVIGVIPSSIPDDGVSYNNVSDKVCEKIADNILDFINVSTTYAKLNISSLPLQFGVGRVANAVLSKLARTTDNPLRFYSEVLPEGILDALSADNLEFASGGAFTMSQAGLQRLFKNWDALKDKIVLRPVEITNSPEVIRRLGVISINTAVEVDIWGNVNSSYADNKVINGIGGSGDFTRNAAIAIFICPSLYKDGSSNIVFSCSHIDHTEHDVDVIVTECGIADLRGLSREKRAREIINKCASPQHREFLYQQINCAKNI